MAGLSNFYSGNMTPPTPVNGKLVPTRIDPGLTSRKVTTVAVDPFTGNPITTGPVIPHATGTLDYNKDQSQLPPNPMQANPALDAIRTADKSWNQPYDFSFVPGTGFTQLQGGNPVPSAPAPPVDKLTPNAPWDPWAGMTTDGAPRVYPPAAPANTRGPVVARPITPPPTPIRSLASMFTPAPSAYSQSPAGRDPAVHAALLAQQGRHNTPVPYSQSPAGRNPSIHAALLAQQGKHNTPVPYSQSPAGLNPSIHAALLAQQHS
jgi:hypothetical protein